MLSCLFSCIHILGIKQYIFLYFRQYILTQMGDNTSKQNLETIVEAIRHLEGDHLFSEESGPHQVRWCSYYSEVKVFKGRRLIYLWGYIFGLNDFRRFGGEIKSCCFSLNNHLFIYYSGEKSFKSVSLRANS